MSGGAVSAALALGAEGPFAGRLQGFAPRAEQIELAAAIERTIAEQATLVAEAGTGIGKTLAYLVPVMQSGQRAILSTGTKTLQDQLFFRDLPLVRQALASDTSAALLKGRANYLCLYRMEQARTHGQLPSREAVTELEELHRWSSLTTDGDLTITPLIAEDSGLWPMVTSTAENCLGVDCPRYEACFVAAARRRAQQSEIVVVNHHLLFADMAIKQGGFGEVLPGAGVFIIDEAHQAPEVASQFFSTSLSARRVSELCGDILLESGQQAGGLATVGESVTACRAALDRLRALVAEHLPERGTWHAMLEREELRDGLQALDQAVADLGPALDALAGASKGIDACRARRAELQLLFDRLDSAAPASEIRWFERRGRGFVLHCTPLDIAEAFTGFREQLDAAWVFTSATVSVGGDFGHYVRQMGLEDAGTLHLDSPFDYRRNALLWIPTALPEPADPQFISELLERIKPVLRASRGRAFLLFTSHRALREAAEVLAQDGSWPLFVQGEAPRSLLLERFRASGNGVLLGAASFWGGVDVMGEALSLVVIDKLPFAAPDDPVMSARGDHLRQEGGNPFMELYLPQAVIALKQGAGRLIRDASDRGALIICDTRLLSRGYGAAFLDSLPPMRRATGLAEVLEFFDHEPVGD